MTHSRNSLVWLLIVALFCAVSFGGCGGSSSNNFSGGGEGNNPNNAEPNSPIPEDISATRAETTLDISFSMDSNGNGKPDFLDFYGVPQYHFDNPASGSSSGVSASHQSWLLQK